MPSSRQGTWSSSSSTPEPPLEAISKDEEVRPAAPMSWMATMASVAISSRQASMSSFSVKGSPTCTVGRFSSESSANSAEAMVRSEEHTSELQSLMRISYAVFCLQKKTDKQIDINIDKQYKV